jgi:hypothetical protein
MALLEHGVDRGSTPRKENKMGRRVSSVSLFAALAVLVTGALAVACGSGSDNSEAAKEPETNNPQAQLVATKLFVDVDVVRGPEGMTTEEKARKSCVQASRIPLGGQVVWRVRVADPKTGELMDAEALASVTAVLPDGQSFAMKYGAHPKDPPGEAFWTASFKVPPAYPTGVLDYKVIAVDKEGRTGEFRQIMSVPSAVLTIVESDPWVSVPDPDNTFALR